MDRKDYFAKSINFVLKYEGGYINHPNDKGGPTNQGITQRVYDSYRKTAGLDVRSVEFIENVEVLQIYYENYWRSGKCEALPNELQIVHFDTCVNCGPSQAAKFLQRTVGVQDDGIIGTNTINAVWIYNFNFRESLTNFKSLIGNYLLQRSDFYYKLIEKDSSQKVFIKGWQNRVKELLGLVNDLIDERFNKTSN
jgi:lysozyme family protein